MLIELSEELSLEDSLFSEEKPQFIDASMLQYIEINIFNFFFIEVLFHDVEYLLIFECLLANI